MKLFASDLDGTLLNVYHKADETINKGIESIYKAGHIFSVCTGRNVALTNQAGLVPSYRICMNGACILDPHDRILASHPMDLDTVRFLLFETPYRFEYQSIDHIYTTGDEETFTKIYRKNQEIRHRSTQKDMERNLKKYTFNCTPEQILSHTIYKVNLHYTDASMAFKIDQLARDHSDKLINAPSVNSLAELTGIGVTKGNAVEELSKLLHIRQEDVFVYGDGINDLSMLEKFEHSYCPSTGTQQAKEAAHYEIGPYDQYSVIRHMQENL